MRHAAEGDELSSEDGSVGGGGGGTPDPDISLVNLITENVDGRYWLPVGGLYLVGALEAAGLPYGDYAVKFNDRNVLTTFCRDLLNNCYDLSLTQEDIVNLGRDTLRDEVAFNKGAEIPDVDPGPDFVRTESLPPMGMTFGVDRAEMEKFWDKLDSVAIL